MDRLHYYIDNLGPVIIRRLSAQGVGTFDILPGDTFKLRIRRRDAAAVVLDKAMTPDPVADTITYQPVPGDFAIEGIYRAWVVLDRGGVTQDTDEFEILVMAHAPGVGVRTARIWRAARAKAPVAWDALRSYPEYGDTELQNLIDLAKLRVMRSVVPVANEDTLDIRVVDYIALKVLVDDVINAAVDYWTNQIVQQSSRSNSEAVQTYPDRIRANEELLKRLTKKLEDQQAEVEEVLGKPTGPTARSPILVGGGLPITPGLESFPRPHRDMQSWEARGSW